MLNEACQLFLLAVSENMVNYLKTDSPITRDFQKAKALRLSTSVSA